MPQITDTPPIEIQNDLNILKADLDSKIPPKKLEQNLLMATWNIRAFGDLTEKWKSQPHKIKSVMDAFRSLSFVG